jgi:hypothetical protein
MCGRWLLLAKVAGGQTDPLVIVYNLMHSDRKYYRPLMRNYLHLYLS